MKRLHPHLLPLVFALLLLAGCAQQYAPSGGPEDKSPPVIVSATPAPGSVDVDTAATIDLVFDEAVNQATLRPAFGLSPPPPGTVRAEWDGPREVSIRFDPPLKDSLTYVLTLGTQLTDMHRNKLQETYVLAFSTGDKLDTGRLGGRLVMTPADPIGWTLAGYYLGASKDVSSEADSSFGADPSADAPDATTQTSADGRWQLSNLRGGWWRVFAFLDQDADRLWTPWSEKIAVPPFDVYAEEDSTRDVRELLLRPSDPLVLPTAARATARQRNLFLLRLDRNPRGIEGTQFSLTEPPEDSTAPPPEPGTIPVVPASFEIQPRSYEYVPGDSATLRIHWERGVFGQRIGLRVVGSFGTTDTLDTTLAVDLSNALSQDTIRPNLVSVLPEEQARLHDGRRRIEWIFSEAVTLGSGGLMLNRSASDTLFPAVQQPFPNRLAVELSPDSAAGGLTFTLLGEKLADSMGNTLADSVLSWTYAYLPDDSLGMVSGSVRAPADNQPLHLGFHSVGGKQLPLRMRLPAPGPFELANVPAGKWVVTGWQDVSGTGSWYEGMPHPYTPSDPVVVSRDTIDVRARWETGGVEIIFP